MWDDCLGMCIHNCSLRVLEWKMSMLSIQEFPDRGLQGLLCGVNKKLLTQHILGPLTKYKLLYVSNQGRG